MLGGILSLQVLLYSHNSEEHIAECEEDIFLSLQTSPLFVLATAEKWDRGSFLISQNHHMKYENECCRVKLLGLQVA